MTNLKFRLVILELCAVHDRCDLRRSRRNLPVNAVVEVKHGAPVQGEAVFRQGCRKVQPGGGLQVSAEKCLPIALSLLRAVLSFPYEYL